METTQESTRQKHIEELREIVAEVLEVEVEQVTETSLFQEDLDADSLRAIEILARLEKLYKINIAQEELAQMTHLTALYDVVKTHTGWDD